MNNEEYFLKMNKITEGITDINVEIHQHYPGCFMFFEPIIIYSYPLKNIFSIPFVMNFADNENFIRFMESSEEEENFSRLMAEFIEPDSGKLDKKSHLIVAFITPKVEFLKLGLPKYDPDDYKKIKKQI